MAEGTSKKAHVLTAILEEIRLDIEDRILKAVKRKTTNSRTE